MKRRPKITRWRGYRRFCIIRWLAVLGMIAGGVLLPAGLWQLGYSWLSASANEILAPSAWGGAICAAFGAAVFFSSVTVLDKSDRRLKSVCFRCANDTWTFVSRHEEEGTAYSGDFGGGKLYTLDVVVRYRCNTCGSERAERSQYAAYEQRALERHRKKSPSTTLERSGQPNHDDTRPFVRPAVDSRQSTSSNETPKPSDTPTVSNATDAVLEIEADWEPRRAVAELEKAGDVEALIKSLGADNNSMRGWAALALGRLNAIQAVEALCQALWYEDVYTAGGYWVSERAAEALESLGDASTLPRKILCQPAMTGDERYRALVALSEVRFHNIHRERKDSILRYRIPDIRRLCEELLQMEPACEGAQAVLNVITSQQLLRPGARNQAADAASLTRPARGLTALQHEQLVRPTETPDER